MKEVWYFVYSAV